METVLKGYIESGKIKHLKQCVPSDKNIKSNGIYTQSLLNCVLPFVDIKENGGSVMIWADDRFLSKCNWTVNVFDILQTLRQESFISQEDYFKHIGELIKHGVKFYVPEADYIFSCLQKAQVRDNDITETPRLEA